MIYNTKAKQDQSNFLSHTNINYENELPTCFLRNSESEKLLDIKIKRKLNFNHHLSD